MSTASPTAAPQPEAGPSNLTARQSGRQRVKSQRQLEAEQTERMLLKSHEQREREAETGSQGASEALTHARGKRQKSGQNRVKRGRVQETFCLCKTYGEDGKPMIECGECEDWYHFDCVKLDEQEVDRIHKYVCAECEEETGQKSLYSWDITTFASPSPPPGSLPLKKRTSTTNKAKKPPRRAVSREASSASSASEAAPDSDETSDSGSDAPTGSVDPGSAPNPRPPVSKRQRHSVPSSKPAKPPADRRQSAQIPPKSARKGALPPARLHVQMRLAQVVKDLFGNKMNDAEAEDFALELESALWTGFSDMLGGKSVVGARYKTQFSLLSSSLPRARPALLESITSRTLTPSQIANLSSADLATDARREELEAARRTALEQTVKQREEVSAVRIVEGGVERVEDTREKEMQRLRRDEEAARERERRASMGAAASEQGAEGSAARERDQMGSPGMGKTGRGTPVFENPGTFARPALPGKRSDSAVSHGGRQGSFSGAQQSPSKSMSMHTPPIKVVSAWGGESAGSMDVDTPQFGDQGELDLSDIVMDQTEEPEAADGSEEDVVAVAPPSPSKERKPVVWHGTINNPASPSANPPRLIVRQVSGRTPVPANHWPMLLPRSNIEITGRVPTAVSLKFLAEGRLNPKREMLCATLELDPKATAEDGDSEERKAWEEMVAYHIGRDRHGVYHPYAGLDGAGLPPGTAKEVYLVPLRPEDPVPETFDLIDGFSLPRDDEARQRPLWLAVFVIVREAFVPPAPVPAPRPAHRAPAGHPPPPPTGPAADSARYPHGAPPAGPAAMRRPYDPKPPAGPVTAPAPVGLPPVDSEALKALMASLGPAPIPSMPPPPPGPQGYGQGQGVSPHPHAQAGGGGLSPMYEAGSGAFHPSGMGPAHPQQGWQAPYPPQSHPQTQAHGGYSPQPQAGPGGGYGGYGAPGPQEYRSPYDDRDRERKRDRRDGGFEQGRRGGGNERGRGGHARERDSGWGDRGAR